MDDDEALLTVEEVAELTRTPVRTVLHWRQTNTGPIGFRLGRHLRYRRADVIAWMEEQRRAAIAKRP